MAKHDHWAGKHCVVTGGCGFIGGQLVADLNSLGASVIAYDIANGFRPPSSVTGSWEKGDILDRGHLKAAIKNADVVFHLAGLLGTAELFEAPARAIETNIIGSLNVILAALEVNPDVRIVFVSKPNEWNNVYSLTAEAIERLALAYSENFGLDVRVLKLWNVYGARQAISPVRKLVPFSIARSLLNHPIEIFGDGSEGLQMCYIEDIAKSLLGYAEVPKSKQTIYEFDVGHTITVNELVHLILAETHSRSELNYLPTRLGETKNTTFRRAEPVSGLVELGPQIPLQIGLRKTVNWYRKMTAYELDACLADCSTYNQKQGR